MLLFAIWAILSSAVLASAGYCHYRYRVENNRYYAVLFAADPTDRRDAEKIAPLAWSENVRLLTFVVVGLLVPMSLAI